MLQDIAVLTGGQVISEEIGLKLGYRRTRDVGIRSQSQPSVKTPPQSWHLVTRLSEVEKRVTQTTQAS